MTGQSPVSAGSRESDLGALESVEVGVRVDEWTKPRDSLTEPGGVGTMHLDSLSSLPNNDEMDASCLAGHNFDNTMITWSHKLHRQQLPVLMAGRKMCSLQDGRVISGSESKARLTRLSRSAFPKTGPPSESRGSSELPTLEGNHLCRTPWPVPGRTKAAGRANSAELWPAVHCGRCCLPHSRQQQFIILMIIMKSLRLSGFAGQRCATLSDSLGQDGHPEIRCCIYGYTIHLYVYT